MRELDELLTRAGAAILSFLLGNTPDQIVEKAMADIDREYEELCESAEA